MHVKTKVLIYAAAIVIVLAYGSIGSYLLSQNNGFSTKINSPITALYFTIVTVSTVGYGDIVPVTRTARAFTMVLIIAGLSVFLSAVTVLSGDIMDSRIDKLSGRISGFERRMLNKHTILIGADAANLSLAEKMRAEGKKFVFLTSDKVIVDKLREDGYNAFIADPTSNKDLLLYNLDKAKTIIIDLKENSRTFYTILLARKLSKSARIIAIVQTKEIEEHVKAFNLNVEIINPSDKIADIVNKNIK